MRTFNPEQDSELDFLIECLRKLVRLDREARAFTRVYPRSYNIQEKERDALRAEINAYFRLQPHMDTWAVFWELLRLAEIPAGTLKEITDE